MGSGRNFLLFLIPASTGFFHPFCSGCRDSFHPPEGAPPPGSHLLLLGEKGMLEKASGNRLVQSACRGDRAKGGKLARDNEEAGPRNGKMRTCTTQTTTMMNIPRWEAAALRGRLIVGFRRSFVSSWGTQHASTHWRLLGWLSTEVSVPHDKKP